MPDPAVVDPSVITPIAPTSTGAMPNTAASTVPMTFDAPPMTQQTEVPNYLSGNVPVMVSAPTPVATPEVKAPISLGGGAPVPPAPNLVPATEPPPPPTTPNAQYPSIQVMSQELKSSGVLLSDIEVRQVPDTSPLAHLQPDHLIKGTNGPEPAYVVKNQAPSTIPLASAGSPPETPSLAATTPGASRSANDPHAPQKMSGLVKIVIVIVAIFAILIIGYLGWQYFTAGAMAGYDGAS